MSETSEAANEVVWVVTFLSMAAMVAFAVVAIALAGQPMEAAEVAAIGAYGFAALTVANAVKALLMNSPAVKKKLGKILPKRWLGMGVSND